MSITVWDIKEAAFTSDFKDVEELILTNKGATDVGAVAQALQLRSLSLAFNSLSNLSGLGPLVRLQSLNVSHNQLVSLKGLQSLTCLVTLNVSHNKVVSLGPLSGLSCLADLWLQHNAVAAPGELRVLAGLLGLQRLAIANNPLAKALPPDTVRLLALRLCPGLRLVDGRPVEQEERTAAESLDLDTLLSTRPVAPGSAPAATPTLGALGSLGSLGNWPADSGGYGSRRPSYTGSVSKAASGGLAGGSGGARGRPGHPTGRLSCGSATSTSNTSNTLPVSSARRPKRVNSFDLSATAPDPLAYSGPSTAVASSTNGPPPDSTPSLYSSSAASSPSPSPNSARLIRSGSGSAGSSSSRRPPLPGATPRPAAQLQGSQFQAVLDALPRFDPAKIPSRATPVRARAPPPPPPPKPPPDAHLVEQEIRYAPQRGGGRAIVVRRDGSAAAFWPGGDMAVTVDADYGAVAAATSTTGLRSEDDRMGSDVVVEAAASGGLAYRMMVMYRAGGVAVSWDVSGGFVQYPSGGLMLMYSRTNGTGTCYSPSGDITRRWRDTDAPAGSSPPPAISIPLPFLLSQSSPSTPPPPPPPPPTHIDMQLDPHLGVRFLAASHTLELYLCCEGVRYRLRCGRNTTGEEWEPPPGRGDGAVRNPNSRLATPSSYDSSQPATPTGSSSGAGTARSQPYISEEGSVGWGGVASTGSGGGGPGVEEELLLPPPAFLRNLARQGGAGTHRPMGGGPASRQGSGLGGGGGAGSGTAGDVAGAAASGGLEGISSITAGLQALELGLQAWLNRDTTPSKSSSKTDEATAAEATGAPDSAPAAAITTNATTSRLPQPHTASASARSRRTGSGSGVSAVRALAAVDAQGAGASGGSDAAATATASPAVENGGSSGAADAGWPSLLSAIDGAAEAGAANMSQDVEASEVEAGCTSSGNGGGRGLDSAVAAQLAAARKLAAESLAAAMAAAGAVAAMRLGSEESST